MAGRNFRSGLTLIEMMIVSAVAAILFVAASSLMVSVSEQRMEARRRIDRLAQSFSAMTLVERELLNAGYHFPSARFGLRVYNNVDNGSSIGGLSVTSGTCAQAGCIVAGTDIVEFPLGHPGPPGILAASRLDAGSLTVFTRFPGPVPVGDVGTHVFLFGDSTGRSCLGVGSANAEGLAIEVVMLDENYAPVLPNYYSLSQPAPHNYPCPTPGMTISATDALRRYFIYQLADGGDLGLYEQVGSGLPSSANMGYVSTTVRPVTLGIDNLQAIPLVSLQGSFFPFTAQCSNGLCRCNALGDCGLDAGTQMTVGEFVDGMELWTSNRGDSPQRTQVVIPRQRLADEIFPNDNIVRTVQSQTLMFRNFSQVQQ